MKINLTVDLSDFGFEDENETISEAIVNSIKSEVIHKVKDFIKAKTDDYIERQCKSEIEKHMYVQMNLSISDFIKTGEVKSSRDSNKMVSVEEFIKEKFVHSSGWNSPDEAIKKLAATFAQDMKNRYDLLFASQLVAKMNESGLLKKDVAKILLAGK